MASETAVTPEKPKESKESREERRARRRAQREGGGVKVVERNQAVYLIMRRLIGAAILATVAAGVSVVGMLGIYGKPVAPVYVPVTDDGHLLPLVPLNQPNVGRGEVGAFALEAIHAINTYDYINFRDQLNQASVYFSPKGWNQFNDQLKTTRTLDAVQERHMIVSVKPMGEVSVPAEASQDGLYTWRVEVPVEVDYTAHAQLANGMADTGNRQKGTVILFISRVPTTINPRGLAIQVYQFRQDDTH
jgi:intracellular multiplication protein IcmL